MRFLSLDVGDKTIGVAVTDALLMTAQGVTTIERIGQRKDADKVIAYIKEYECEIVENIVAEVANKEKTVPDEFISENANDVTDKFIQYCRPLIMGNPEIITEDGVPKHIIR